MEATAIGNQVEYTGDPEDLATLVSKLTSVMEEVQYIKKTGENSYHGYSYLTEKDLVEKIRKPLIDENVMIFTSSEEVETQKNDNITRVRTEHTFVCGDTGATVTVQSRGQGQDDQDKGGYKAITGSMKYFLYKTFLVPAGDDPEQDQYISGQNIGKVYKGAETYGLSRSKLNSLLEKHMGVQHVSEVHVNDKNQIKQIIRTHGTHEDEQLAENGKDENGG